MATEGQLGDLHRRCEQFLYREAACLDDGRLHDWLALLTDDVEYRVPRRLERERGSEQPTRSEDAYHFRDDRGTLETRVQRYDHEYAWAENPPSRTRRFVSNVRVEELGDDEFEVTSNLLLYRDRGDGADHDLLVGERIDCLRLVDGELKLAERVVDLDQPVIPSKNLSFFL